MFDKILIANRGEIACRIVRTARQMGVAAVAVCSDADSEALHVADADEAVLIGAGPATESYLRADRIIEAARQTGAQAIHPGYGFLAENAEFAEACRNAGIAFIGPSPEAMRALGGKAEAKRLAEASGVPTVPGYKGDAQDAETLAKEAKRIGYPIVIKAVAGGGGRGMRIVDAAAGFKAALESAVREAQSAFGDGRVLLEKRVMDPRHIEVQVFGDSHGNVVHLFERDCTLQRRNQKVIEEAPAPGMSPELRAKMTAAAVALAKSVGYEGAGTVEFLVEGGELHADAPWYFIEMNTRLQVEHPVTEEITGLDLVEWQLRVAAGEKLPLAQDAIAMRGHAMEVRVCAEDPERDFQPSIGRVHRFAAGGDAETRVETGIEDGSSISPFYDSMIAKLIACGEDRTVALGALRDALQGTQILGVKTNLAFLDALLALDDVVDAQMTTATIGVRMDELSGAEADDREAVAAGVKVLLASERRRLGGTGGAGPWHASDAFQLDGERRLRRPVLVDGAPREVELVWAGGTFAVEVDGEPQPACDASELDWENGAGGFMPFGDEPVAEPTDQLTACVLHRLRHIEVSWPTYDADALEAGDASDLVKAPITGRVAKLHVAVGDEVEENQPVAVVEAMKMEHVLTSPRTGRIARLDYAEGEQVTEGAIILALEAEEAAS